MKCFAGICSSAAPVVRKPTLKAGACPWATESVAFKRWVSDAVSDSKAERAELHAFLTECFRDADTDRDGLIGAQEFHYLVNKAAALPLRFGLAWFEKDVHKDAAARQERRAELFRKMDADNSGYIGIDEWIQYSFQHIAQKVKTMPMKSPDFENLHAFGRGNFMHFLKTAVSDRASAEYREFYQFLLKNFVMADTDQKGSVTFEQFDRLVQLSDNALGSLGLALPANESSRIARERMAARRRLFDSMDLDKGGTISFDEYLKCMIDQVAEKVQCKAAEEPVFAMPEWKTSASAFARWVRAAVERPTSEERREFYAFLSECFMDADEDRDGLISKGEFGFLCEMATALPRRFALEASPEDLCCTTAAARGTTRLELFEKVDSSKRGAIGMDDWVKYALSHFEEMVKGMEKREKSVFSDLAFLKRALGDRSSREYTEVYQFLFDNFARADKEAKGSVTAQQMDRLLELSADAPHALGLDTNWFKTTPAARRVFSVQIFKNMDKDHSGAISFDEYLQYTMKHIESHIASLGEGVVRRSTASRESPVVASA